MREERGAGDEADARWQRHYDIIHREAEQLQHDLTEARSELEALAMELAKKEEELEDCRADVELGQQALSVVDGVEQENRFLRDQVAELTLALRERGGAADGRLEDQDRLQDELEDMRELLARERQVAHGQVREFEQARHALLDETRNELDLLTRERDELAYKLAESEQQLEAMKEEQTSSTSRRDHLETLHKDALERMELAQRELEQRSAASEKVLRRELHEAHQCNDELLEIFSNMDRTMQQKDNELQMANERIQTLEKLTQISPDTISKDEQLKELQTRLKMREDRMIRERTRAREKMAELIDERSALEQRISAMQERNDRIQGNTRAYYEEIRAVRVALANSPSGPSGLSRTLEDVLQKLKNKQHEVDEMCDHIKTLEEQHLSEIMSLRKRLRKRDEWVTEAMAQLEKVNERKNIISAVLQQQDGNGVADGHDEDSGDDECGALQHFGGAANGAGFGSAPQRPALSHRRAMSYAAPHGTAQDARQKASLQRPKHRRGTSAAGVVHVDEMAPHEVDSHPEPQGDADGPADRAGPVSPAPTSRIAQLAGVSLSLGKPRPASFSATSATKTVPTLVRPRSGSHASSSKSSSGRKSNAVQMLLGAPKTLGTYVSRFGLKKHRSSDAAQLT
ncbi:hypothetical protein THASP1DRAFT_29918 [Thamnocephalis sphaerospora]|uniref:Uncharacterized protein n=1 Tax=Thamnocephalis sphaerospora TaxID=78915 RepID=A0A4P9XQH4_9FUNG|nr:hypothetical protein THASP1DRAFT_29918 [Thamnocephalis sphaerospora]|eukprot:RKP08285.1 hypothetical protein THASP1DRAFT_29918 [Thamnocephalis sphaerospora]